MSVPIISGFHPDPTICEWQGSYYLANSSFEYSPGIPIHRSTNLIDWELIGNAAQGRASVQAKPSRGIFAPTLRHHDDLFWLIFTDMSSAVRGQLLMTAENATGPWSAPLDVPVTGIDPDIVWDDDACYVSWAQWDPELGPAGIWQAQIDDRTGALLESPRHLWSGTGLAYPEGPHLYRVGEWWYLLIAEGGTERGHSVSIARSGDIRGPFEAAPSNPIFSHRSLDVPVQNTGHADLIRLPDGDWAAVYLGVRVSGPTPYYHLNGRETFLAGIEWVDGWPRFLDEHYDVTERDHSFVDVFDLVELAPNWVTVSGRTVDDGQLLLGASERVAESPLLLTRVRDQRWRARSIVRGSGGRVRLILRLDDTHWYAVTLSGSRVEAELCIGGHPSRLRSAAVSDEASVVLELRSLAPSAEHSLATDVIELSVTVDGARTVLGAVDGRYLSTEVAGGFTGRMVGLEALEGQVRVTEFQYTTAP